MSQENVTRFREATEAFNRGDLQAWLQYFDPDCVFEPQVAVVEGLFIGHDGVKAFGQATREIFDTFQVDFDEVRDLGDDRVLAYGSASSATDRWFASRTSGTWSRPSKPPVCPNLHRKGGGNPETRA